MTACLAPRHDEPVPAAPHATLCRPCTARLRSDLHALPRLAAGLAELLDPRRASGPGTGDGVGLPYNEPAAECISQVRHDVEYWTAVVLAEFEPNVCPVRTLPAMCGWLAGQAERISFRGWAADMAGALRADVGRAMAVLDPMPRASIPIPADANWCPACGTAGMLSAVIAADERDRRPSLVSCAGCGHEWDPAQWLRLGERIIRHRDAQRAVYGNGAAA